MNPNTFTDEELATLKKLVTIAPQLTAILQSPAAAPRTDGRGESFEDRQHRETADAWRGGRS
jgi:hypothetical protein